MAKLKKSLLFAVGLLPIAIVAGIFVVIYQMDIYPEEMLREVTAQLGSTDPLILIGALQTAGYALVCGFFGHMLAEKTGLWKPIRLEKKAFFVTAGVSLVGGAVFSLDHWVFGTLIEGIQETNAGSLTVSGVIASVLYGGIIEEVLLRLFFLSLIAFILWKLFARRYDRENIPSGVFMAANVIAAVLFAAGHLPATAVLFGELTPLILLRCFLLNGGFGLIFGWLYRKYGIAYSMLCHALFHIVCKLIWILFV